ncbi:MAG: GNAT family N-acetyltransferase [Coprobacillus cateniformis]|uniref:GNAT family N-acetyltransferase n=1 Tax=Longibaculum muris TaxID=1796628 RepID=UPI003AB8B94F|nr:GNAT family N-acetyltransferase [Coprobacillus cateniformis]
MRIEEVPINHPDLLKLVRKLDYFFEEQWGKDIAEGYQSFHQLSKMAYAVVCYNGKQAIGCGCYKIIDQQTVEIKRMFVEKQYRRQKVASSLLNALERHAQQHHFDVAVLETGKDMQDNILFYQKCGYHLIDNFGDFVGDLICVCMEKSLNSI